MIDNKNLSPETIIEHAARFNEGSRASGGPRNQLKYTFRSATNVAGFVRQVLMQFPDETIPVIICRIPDSQDLSVTVKPKAA